MLYKPDVAHIAYMSLREAVFIFLCVNYFVNYLNTHTATHAHSHWHTHFALKRLFPYIYDVCKYIAYRLFHYISLCAIAISDRRCESAQLIRITSVLICTFQLLSIVVDCYRFSWNFSEFFRIFQNFPFVFHCFSNC